MTAKLCGPGGVRAVIAENLLLKQQLIVLRRPRQRAPNLTTADRLLCGFASLFLNPGRIRKVAVGLRPSTLLAFHSGAGPSQVPAPVLVEPSPQAARTQGAERCTHPFETHSKYCPAFDEAVRDGGARPVQLPPRSSNLNAYAEHWVRSVKDECLAKLILIGEPALRTALRAYVEHFHGERNHQGKDNFLLFPCEEMGPARARAMP